MGERLLFNKGNRARSIFIIGNILFFVGVCLIVLIPIIKVVSDSLDQKASLISFRLWPEILTLDAYKMVLSQSWLYQPFLISILTTVVGTILSLTITTLFAYGLSQRDLLGKRFIMIFVLITMVFRAGIIPLFFTMKALKLTETLYSVIAVCLVDAFYLILLKNFFSTIPKDIIDAANIDGCSSMRIFFQIIIPLSKAGLAAVGLFIIVNYWNMFFEYLMFITNPKLHNFQVRVREIVIESETQGMERTQFATQTLRNAVVVITIIPVMIIYPFVQKYFVKGVNLGAIKE